MNCLALDIGGSSGRLLHIALNGGKLSLSTVYRFGNAPTELNGHLYWDLLGIWNEVCRGLEKAAASGCTFDSMGIDAFCNDYSFIDGTGRLMSPVSCYRDPRSIENAERIFSLMPKEELYARNGNQIAPFNTLMHLAVLSFERSPFFDPERYTFLFFPDLISYYLTGVKNIEYTLCSVTQFYDYVARALDEGVLSRFSIPKGIFPPIVEPGTVRGLLLPAWRSQPAFRDTEMVAVCEHDTASAFLGIAADEPAYIISGGTWMLVGVENDRPVIAEEGFRCNIGNEGSVPGHHRILRNVMGSWLFAQLIEDLRRAGTVYGYPELIALARGQEPCTVLIDVDDLDFYSPGNIREKIRRHGVTRGGGPVPDDPAVYARCIYDSLALRDRWAVEKLAALTGGERRVINVIGGASQDELLCRLIADACGMRVIAGPVEATALGNAIVQLMAKGAITSVEEGRALVRASFPVKVYEPEDTAFWNEQYERYLETVLS